MQNGEHLLVADEPAPFAQAVLRVLDDQDLAAAMGRSGRALVEREYSWASIVESLEAFFTETLAVKTPASRADTEAGNLLVEDVGDSTARYNPRRDRTGTGR